MKTKERGLKHYLSRIYHSNIDQNPYHLQFDWRCLSNQPGCMRINLLICARFLDIEKYLCKIFLQFLEKQGFSMVWFSLYSDLKIQILKYLKLKQYELFSCCSGSIGQSQKHVFIHKITFYFTFGNDLHKICKKTHQLPSQCIYNLLFCLADLTY